VDKESIDDGKIFDDDVLKEIEQAVKGTRRAQALQAAAEAYPNTAFHTISEIDRGVLELARSFEKYLKSG